MSDQKFEYGNRSWVMPPIKWMWIRRRGRPPLKDFRVMIPTILNNLAPATVFDPTEAWAKEKEREAVVAAAAATAVAASSSSKSGGKSSSSGTKKKEEIIRENLDMNRQKNNYSTDHERIVNKKKEGGIPALLTINQRVSTDRGRLELMLEVLALAVQSGDMITAVDVFWAIRDNKAYIAAMSEIAPPAAAASSSASATPAAAEGADASIEERVKVIMRGINGMNMGALQKECKARNVNLTGVKVNKEGLVAAIRKHLMETEGQPAAAAAPEPPAKEGKSKKSSSSSSAAADPPAAPVDKSPEVILVESFRAYMDRVESYLLADKDVTAMQLTSMSHLLPPLSPFYQEWRLDDWQKRALRCIDENKSILICAPTSSGKTVISSYVASMWMQSSSTRPQAPVTTRDDGVEEIEEDDEEDSNTPTDLRVLFVVPTDALVWQVAAHFTKFITADAKVAIVTDHISYTPSNSRIVVGTPFALETCMTKIRGKDGSEIESRGEEDRSVLRPGFNTYKWAVFDEVHSLNSETPDGAALQRLMRLVTCPFIALSATVGNGEQLRSWMEEVRGETLGRTEVINAPAPGWEEAVFAEKGQAGIDAMEATRLVQKQVHEGRFINLQRHLWCKSPSSARPDHLEPLSPLAAVDVEFLQNDGFKKCSLPMTPLDCFNLWLRLKELFPTADVADIEPKVFFAAKWTRGTTAVPDRITLKDSKQYEDAMKNKLVFLARKYPEITARLLSSMSIPDLGYSFDSVRPRMATATEPAAYGDMCDLIWKLRGNGDSEDKLPALVFHLDMFELFERFKSLVSGLEIMQKTAHPKFYSDLMRKVNVVKAEMESELVEAATEKEKEDIRIRYGPMIASIDVEQPHPDYMLSRRVSADEIKKIVAEMEKEDKIGDDVKAHTLIRALRRGIAIFINHVSFQAYRRNVMKLALQGKLAVVFSDASLAYGVNMPFRSCVFCGDMGGQLDSLMLQQMSGRAGRRGLDTQGHLIYAGTSSALIRKLTLGIIPAVTGVEYRYHTQQLQSFLSAYVNPRASQILSRRSLREYMEPSAPALSAHFDADSTRTLEILRFVKSCPSLTGAEARDFDFSMDSFENDEFTGSPSGHCPNGRITALLWMVWSLRDRLPESIVLGTFLPYLYDHVMQRPRPSDFGNTDEDQFEFMCLLLTLVDRKPKREGKKSLMEVDFVAARNNDRREELRNKMVHWSEVLARFRDEKVAQMPHRHMVMFPEAGEIGSGPCTLSIDATLLQSFIDGHANGLAPMELQDVIERIYYVGTILINMNNHLFMNKKKYGILCTVIIKCQLRFSYLTRELLAAHMHISDVTAFDLEKTR